MKKIIFELLVAPLLLLAFTSVLRAQDPMAIAEGAKLWSNNCMRCHNARSPLERDDRAWTTIAMHMRARANLTKSEVAAIITYLHGMNVPESPGPSGAADVLADADKEISTTKKEEAEPGQLQRGDEPPSGKHR